MANRVERSTAGLPSSPTVDRVAGSAAGGVAVLGCDFCGGACAKGQRFQLIWESETGDELVLADLCPRCAARADRLLDVYGGRGRASMRLTEPDRADAIPVSRVRRASETLVRGLIYVSIALAVFFVVTLITSRG